MKSKLHQDLQDKAQSYLLDKSYWITRVETPVSIGICDVWGMKSEVGNYDTIAIEVKISRNDFGKNKYKEASSVNGNPMANRHYIMCPTNLVKPSEICPSWGLLYWDGVGRIKNMKQAQFVEMSDRQKLYILTNFLASKQNKIQP